jgi:hypothetical protein
VDLYGWLVYGHILAVILAFAAHGVSAFVSFRVRREHDRARLAALLDLSGSSLIAASVMLLIAIILGITAAISGGHFAKFWPWAAIVVLVVVIGAMTPLAATPLRRVRQVLAIVPVKAGEPAPAPGSDADLAAALAAVRPEATAVIGIAGIAILGWLMRAKPF